MSGKSEKNKKNRPRKNLMSVIGVPEDVAFDLPTTTVIGTNKLEIDNYKNIVSYSRNLLKLNTTIGLISIEGSDLLIREINTGQITVSGEISSVFFESRS